MIENFKNALKGCNHVKCILDGVGESELFSSKEVFEYIEQLEADAKIGVAMKEWWSCETATVDDCATNEILLDWYGTQDPRD